MGSTTVIHPESLLAWLAKLPDRRRRQGRRYPLAAVMGMLVLAAIHGESSLRGMWLWSQVRWQQLWSPLGFFSCRRPRLSTVWYIASSLDGQELERLLGQWIEDLWGQGSRRVSIDGKTLRGSRRQGQSALRTVEAVGQELKLVLQEHSSAEGDDVAAALALLREMPLQGRLATLDAGLLQRRVVETIRERGGEYLGMLKENHPELKEAVDEWVAEHVLPHGKLRPPDVVEIDKGHGRVERRELWVVDGQELGIYLEQEYHWPGVKQVGWIRRFRWQGDAGRQQAMELHAWITSMKAGPAEIARGLRGHWVIENAVHRVRDVTWDEDRLHGRAIGLVLAALRNTAMNLIRGLGYTFIPDGWRHISARPDYGLPILTKPLEH